MSDYFIVGGAGFIGSHLARAILTDPSEPRARVTVYDNFSSGRLWHLEGVEGPRLRIVRGDVKDLPTLTGAMAGHAHVYHFASNPDIARAAKEPDIDFWEGTYLTQNVLEAMRRAGVPSITYASGSGVYGDTGSTPVYEAFAPLAPVSTYGASKLAGEALICSYSHMFGVRGLAFRFANVVGPRQTHGVCHDFIRRLLADPTRLSILGDGSQSKSYIHVSDVIAAMRLLSGPGGRSIGAFDVFNVATEDYITVKAIADLVCRRLGLIGVSYEFGTGPRGWKGDVPVVRFDTTKLRSKGWSNALTTTAALTRAIDSMIADARGGQLYGAAA